MRQQAPMNEVARVMKLDARKPLERRGGNVVILADAEDGRIRIEAAQDRVGNFRQRERHRRLRDLSQLSTEVSRRSGPAPRGRRRKASSRPWSQGRRSPAKKAAGRSCRTH